MGLAGNESMPTTRFNGIRTSESILGTSLPILLGQQRLSWKLIWYSNFQASTAKQQSGGGGSGLSKGGTQYVYSASVVGSVCMGNCQNFLAVWDSIGRFAMDTYTETTTLSGTTYVPANQAFFKQDIGASVTSSYSVTANDYGSPGSITYSGTQQVPLTYINSGSPSAGQYTVTYTPVMGGPFSGTAITASAGTEVITGTFPDGGSNAYAGYMFSIKNAYHPENNGQFPCVNSSTTSITLTNTQAVTDPSFVIIINPITGAPVYTFNSAQTGASIVVNYVAYRYNIQENELDVVPSTSPYQVTVQYQAFQPITDLGVTYYPSGIALAPVSGTPSVTGTYNPNSGNYLFAPGDAGAGVVISYIFNNQTVDSDVNAPNTINLTFFGGGLGQAPWSYLTSSYPDAAIGYSEVAYVASSGLYLGYSPVLPQYNFEILGPYSFGGAPTNGAYYPGDANPADAILALLVNPEYKLNFPYLNIGSSLNVGNSSARNMWTTNNFFISDILDSQTPLMSIFSRWCEAGQVYMSWDEGLLKFTPLVDTTCIGNGATYTPPTQPIIDLDDNDFVVGIGKNVDPIIIEQTPWQSRWNRIQVRWSVRTNDYNEDILQVQDEASVQQFGLMMESAQDWQFICWEEAAQFAANMRLQRYSAIYTTYSFTLKANFAFLSPGDIITITDGLLGTSGTMFGRTPCRITKMTDDPKKGVIIEAENFPWSVGAALLKNVQAQNPSNTNDGPQENPGDTTAIIFEVPNEAAQWNGDTIYIFANGSNVNWGGFQAWVSFNGTDYNFYGQYSTPARVGTSVASTTSCIFTLTQIAVSGSTVTYSYSSYTGTISVVGAGLVVTGFTNAGNNSDIIILTISGGSSGTFTAVYLAQVNETHAGLATGGYPTVTSYPGLPFLDSTDTLTVSMAQSGAVLQSVTESDLEALVTLAAIVSPGISTIEVSSLGGNAISTGASGSTGTSGSQGPLTVTSGISQNPGYASVNWLNPSDVTGSSGYATVNLSLPSSGFGSSYESYYLLCTGPGFTVPYLGIGPIVGLQVTFEAYNSATTGGPQTSFVVWLTYRGSVITSEIASGINLTGTPTTYTLGSSGNLTFWGFNPGGLTYGLVNDSSFGIQIQAIVGGDSSSTVTVDIKNVQFTVTWGVGLPAVAWTNASNAITTSSSYASALFPGTSDASQWLYLTNFNFQLPFGFVLAGIKVTCKAGSVYMSAEPQLTAYLSIDGQRVGTARSGSIFPGAPGLVTLGSVVDTWDYEWDTADFNSNGNMGFGVWLGVTDYFSDTVSINSVTVDLFGESATNLELIAYETATLVGQNTYALTDILRGCQGSFPCDHPVGSTFARLDQATLTYTVPSNYVGNYLYFKFLSFNAYGNQLQSLSQVVPYSIPIGGLAPGAIDNETGALLTGTPNYSVNEMESVFSTVNGAYGAQNIPQGYALIGQSIPAGPPQWVPLVVGGGGTGTVVNLFVTYQSANYNANPWDLVFANTSSAGFTVTFPLAASNPNTTIGVKLYLGTNTLTLAPSSGDTLEITTIATLEECLYFASDGINQWRIWASYVSSEIEPLAADMVIYTPPAAGIYTSSQELFYTEPGRDITLPTSLTGSHAGCRTAPTGNVTATLFKNTSSIGTVNITASATTATFTFSSAVSFNGTSDTFKIVAPSSADATFAGFWIWLVATRSN